MVWFGAVGTILIEVGCMAGATPHIVPCWFSSPVWGGQDSLRSMPFKFRKTDGLVWGDIMAGTARAPCLAGSCRRTVWFEVDGIARAPCRLGFGGRMVWFKVDSKVGTARTPGLACSGWQTVRFRAVGTPCATCLASAGRRMVWFKADGTDRASCCVGSGGWTIWFKANSKVWIARTPYRASSGRWMVLIGASGLLALRALWVLADGRSSLG